MAIEDMANNSTRRLTEQYYKFLVFVWAVSKGHARTLIKFSDPPDDDSTDLLLERAQEKLEPNKAQGERNKDRGEDKANKNKDDGSKGDRKRSPDRDGHRDP